ncbi:hypothetical protein [Bacillus massiliglaciei]|uniref:hypothetical protein n=1 Tax=Bacillus massiliglaciei TaxID=1816693 RepID=UPI0018FED544|nr:hypothetical protein [Bacillus massiliglaciei]
MVWLFVLMTVAVYCLVTKYILGNIQRKSVKTSVQHKAAAKNDKMVVLTAHPSAR